MCLLASWINRYQLSNNVIWKKIIDYKYKTKAPNIFYCPDIGASPFWKGVLWASKAAQLGAKWKVGDGKSIRFWEDHWFGTCSLTIQFWDLYVLTYQKNKTIAELWDGETLKISFRRKFSPRLMQLWMDLLFISESISFTDDWIYCPYQNLFPLLMTVIPSSGLLMEAVASRFRLFIKLLVFEAFNQSLRLASGIFVSLPVSIPFFGFSQTTKL